MRYIMSTLTLSRPEKGLVTTLSVTEDITQLSLGFPLGDGLFEKVGENLEISFDESGTKIILENFYTNVDSENIPDFLTLDGSFTGEDFFAALDESLMPAAGNEAPTPPANDGLRSGDDSGAEGAEGIESLGQGSGNGSDLPEGQQYAYSAGRAGQQPAVTPTSLPTPPTSDVTPPTSGDGSIPPPLDLFEANAKFAQRDEKDDKSFYVTDLDGKEMLGDKAFEGEQRILHTSELKSWNTKSEINLGEGGDALKILANANTRDVDPDPQRALNTGVGGRMVINMGTGNDSADLEGSTAMYARAANNNNIKANAVNILTTGDGVDTVNLKATDHAMLANGAGKKNTAINEIKLGADGDKLTIEAGVDSNEAAHAMLATGKQAFNKINAGDGADTVTISTNNNEHSYAMKADANGVNEIDLDKGADKLEVSGDIRAVDFGKNTINLGKGHDDFILTGEIRAINGGENTINLGKGDDEFILTGDIRAVDGKNTINLGKGNDLFEISGKITDTNFDATSTTNNNIIDGGDGVDTLKLSDVLSSNKFVFDGTTAEFTIKDVDANFKNFEKFEFSDASETLDFTNFNSDVTLVWTLDSFGGKDTVNGFDIAKDSIDLTSLNLQNTDSIRVEITGKNSTSIFIEAADGTVQEIAINGATFDKQDLDYAVSQGDSFITI